VRFGIRLLSGGAIVVLHSWPSLTESRSMTLVEFAIRFTAMAVFWALWSYAGLHEGNFLL